MRDSTLKSVAQRVGVSVSTVSRVLNGKTKQYRISKQTELAVLNAAKELNYHPNQIARGLRIQRTHTLGLIIPDISNPFFSIIARSIEKQARKANYSILLCDSQENIDIEIESIRLLQSRQVDGLIICPVGIKHKHLEKLVTGFKMPLVIVDRGIPGMNCSSVTSENYEGALAAISYLIENGHTTIGCIQGLVGNTVNSQRIQGYIDGHRKYDIPVQANLIVGSGFGEENGHDATVALLELFDRPTALYSCSNMNTFGAIQAIHEAGLSIPDDISFITFDDANYFNYLSTPITAVSQTKEEMGLKAFELLIDQIEHGKKDSQHITLPTKIIVRQSVKQLKKAMPTTR